MRKQHSVQFTVLLFALLLTPFVARSQNQAVHAWGGSITIPTYELGPADPNPPFPLVESNPVYPYTMLDNLTDHRVMQKYHAIYLENQYLKITILPELGGHVYSVYDKVDHREVLYRNHVIKYGLVGPRGAWISGGLEFSFPYAHTTDTVSTVESILHQNQDGSATAIVGAVDWVSNMHWEIAITLRPNTARVEEGVTLFNSTPLNHLYLFWTNAAVKTTDDTQYIYPMRETIDDNPFAIVQSWPVWKGVDQSWYKNDPSALAIFGRDVQRSFFGVYYHQSNYGIVHVADYRQDPGKKLWTWGNARSGKIWDKILSDDDGSYNEIQSGRFYTQGYREFMNPRRVEKWTEYWYPVRGLDGGFVEATKQMAINTNFMQSEQGQPQVRLTISPVAHVTDATVVVRAGAKILNQYAHVRLTPLEPTVYVVPVESLEKAKKDLNVEIQSAQGDVLLQWSAAAPIDGNPDFVPAVGKALDTKLSVAPHTPVEELYLHGVFVEKTGNLQGAMKTYSQVLERDPGYVPALLKEAWYFYRAADFSKAESLITRAIERGKEDPDISYASGVIYRADGKTSLARNAFWDSIHYGSSLAVGPSLASSYVELGEIAIRERNYPAATKLLERAVGYNPNDAFAMADLAVAERLSGDVHGAARHSAEAVQKMPLLPYALAESWQDGSSQADTSWTKIISSDPQNYLAIAAWYHDLGAWDSSDEVLHAAISNLPTQDVSPMVFYYMAANAREEGKTLLAEEYGKRAASLSSASVFPNRITDVAVLQEAILHDPSDAGAKYALGNFLFAHARYEQAADLWTTALAEGFNNPVLLRNLGVYQWHVKKNLAKAVGFYARAIQLNPNDYRLYTSLDEIYTQQDNTTAREKLFDGAPKAVLDQDTVRAARALLFLEQARPNDALVLLAHHTFKPWEGGVVIHNMFVEANMEKGKQALADRKPTQAAENFRRALSYPENLGTGEPPEPENAKQLYWLGNALQAEGNTAEATAAWKQAAAQGTVFSALAYEKLGQDTQAQQLLDRYIQTARRPDASANDCFMAGIAERYSGHAEQARLDLQRALELNPLFWEARIELNDLNMSNRKAA